MLAQSKILNEARVFAIRRLATEGVYHDFSHAGGDLLTCPGCLLRNGKVRFVRQDPTCKFSDRPESFRKLNAPRPRCCRAKVTSGYHGDRPWQPNGELPVGKRYRRHNTRNESKGPQQGFHPIRPDELGLGANRKLSRELLKTRQPVCSRNSDSKAGVRPNCHALQSARAHKEPTQKIERSVGQTEVCARCCDLAHHTVDELARSEEVLRFRVFDLDVEGFLDSHDDFDPVHAHEKSCGLAAARCQERTE
jgi:hypothetical protein